MSVPRTHTAFSTTLRTALESSRMTLSELRDQLAAKGHPLSLTALSYWRSGRRLPERRTSIDAIPDLEQLLGLEPGALGRFVAGSSVRRLGRVEPFDGLLDYPVRERDGEVEFVGESDISRVATHIHVTVGAHQVERVHGRRIVVANRDGVEGMTMFIGTTEANGADSYRFTALSGCTIHEDHQPALNIRSVQLRFPRPLQFGESAITEVEVTQFPDPVLEPVTDYELAAEQRLEEALIWVSFNPESLPSRCWVYFSEHGLKHEWEVDIRDTASVHYRQRDFGPGGLGVRWEW